MDDSTLTAHKPILLRSNRFLGAALQEHNLASVEALESANQSFLDLIQAGELRRANLLSLLLQGEGGFSESDLLTFLVEQRDFGLVDLQGYDLEKTLDISLDPALCWATQTLPFDKVESLHFVATAYALSEPVIRWWEERLEGHVLWYVISQRGFHDAFQRLDALVGEGAGAPA